MKYLYLHLLYTTLMRDFLVQMLLQRPNGLRMQEDRKNAVRIEAQRRPIGFSSFYGDMRYQLYVGQRLLEFCQRYFRGHGLSALR